MSVFKKQIKDLRNITDSLEYLINDLADEILDSGDITIIEDVITELDWLKADLKAELKKENS